MRQVSEDAYYWLARNFACHPHRFTRAAGAAIGSDDLPEIGNHCKRTSAHHDREVPVGRSLAQRTDGVGHRTNREPRACRQCDHVELRRADIINCVGNKVARGHICAQTLDLPAFAFEQVGNHANADIMQVAAHAGRQYARLPFGVARGNLVRNIDIA